MNRVIIIIFFSVMIFSSCSVFRKSKTSEALDLSRKELLKRKLDAPDRYKNTLVDFRLFLNNGENQNIDVRLYMEKDEKIFISLRFMGFEIARAMWLKDSLYYINRLKKEFYFGEKEAFPYYNFEGLEISSFYNYINYELFIEDLNIPVSKLYRDFNEGPIDGFEQETVLYNGRKVLSFYDSQLKLDRFRMTDHDNSFFIEGDITRNNGVVQGIAGILISGRDEIKWGVEINAVKDQSYSRTKFNVGKNYTRIE